GGWVGRRGRRISGANGRRRPKGPRGGTSPAVWRTTCGCTSVGRRAVHRGAKASCRERLSTALVFETVRRRPRRAAPQLGIPRVLQRTLTVLPCERRAAPGSRADARTGTREPPLSRPPAP